MNTLPFERASRIDAKILSESSPKGCDMASHDHQGLSSHKTKGGQCDQIAPAQPIDGRDGWAEWAAQRRETAHYVANCIDETRGMIFGGDGIRVQLVSPNGNVQETGHLCGFASIKDRATYWGQLAKDKLLDAKTGDGKTLREWPEIFESIYGKGQWEIRYFHA